MGAKIFQKSRTLFKILGIRMVRGSKSRAEDPYTLSATVQSTVIL